MKDNIGITYTNALTLYKNFVRKLMHEERFFNEHPLLTKMEEGFSSYTGFVEEGCILYRARIVDVKIRNNYLRENGFRGFNKEHSFVPPQKSAKENRASPAGIVYLYVAENEHTAIAEVRPSMLDEISVARIKVLQRLKILDLSFNFPVEILLPHKGSHTLTILAKEYMVPLDIKDNNGGYLPTQLITEFIRKHEFGFDGIRYNSSLDLGGKNLVIFNYKKCEPVESDIYKVNLIEYCALGQTGNKHIIEGKRLQDSRRDAGYAAAGKLIIDE